MNNAADYAILKESHRQLMKALEDTLNASAACFRVIASYDDGATRLDAEMNRCLIEHGFGVKAKNVLADAHKMVVGYFEMRLK